MPYDGYRIFATAGCLLSSLAATREIAEDWSGRKKIKITNKMFALRTPLYMCCIWGDVGFVSTRTNQPASHCRHNIYWHSKPT